MGPNRRRVNTYNAPKVEVVKIDPPKPPVHHVIPEKPKKGFLGGLLNNINFDAEDILLIGLMLLFLNLEDEDYGMMLPALIYIFLG